MIESLDIQILTLINRGFAIFNSAASAFQTLMAAALSSGSIASPTMIHRGYRCQLHRTIPNRSGVKFFGSGDAVSGIPQERNGVPSKSKTGPFTAWLYFPTPKTEINVEAFADMVNILNNMK